MTCPAAKRFHKLVNMTPAQIRAWHKNPRSKRASFPATRARLPALADLKAGGSGKAKRRSSKRRASRTITRKRGTRRVAAARLEAGGRKLYDSPGDDTYKPGRRRWDSVGDDTYKPGRRLYDEHLNLHDSPGDDTFVGRRVPGVSWRSVRNDQAM